MWRAGLPAAPTPLHGCPCTLALFQSQNTLPTAQHQPQSESHATGTAHQENKPTLTSCLRVPVPHHILSVMWSTSLFPCQRILDISPRKLSLSRHTFPSLHTVCSCLTAVFVQRPITCHKSSVARSENNTAWNRNEEHMVAIQYYLPTCLESTSSLIQQQPL